MASMKQSERSRLYSVKRLYDEIYPTWEKPEYDTPIYVTTSLNGQHMILITMPKRRKTEEEKKRWCVSVALKSNVKIEDGRFGTVTTKQKVTLKDFDTIQYISKPIPDPIFFEILNLWKRKNEPDERPKNDIYNDDAYYIDHCGSHNYDIGVEVWQRRDEGNPRREQSCYIKETVLQSKWGEKKERPLPNIPKMMYLSDNLYNEPEGDDESTTYLKQRVDNDSYLETDTEIYVDEPHKKDIKVVNRRPPLTLAPQPPPTTKILLQVPAATINEVTSSNNRCGLRDIQSRHRRPPPPPLPPPPPPPRRPDDFTVTYDEPDDVSRSSLPQSFHQSGLKPHKLELPLPLEQSPPPIIHDSNTEICEFPDDTWRPPPPPPIVDPYRTTKTDKSKHKKGPVTIIKKLKMPTLTWTEPQPPSSYSESDSRVSSESSGFIHVGCEAACSCHTAPKTMTPDCTSTSTSSGFLRVDLGPADVYEKPSEQDVQNSDYENDICPPPIPPRVPISNVPLDDPKKETEEDNADVFECSEQVSPSRHGVDITRSSQFTSDDISKDNSKLPSDTSVFETCSHVLMKGCNKEEVIDTTEDQLKCEYHFNTVPKEVVEQRSIFRDNEQNNKTIMTEQSTDIHDEVRLLQNKRRAIEERNTVDKAKIDEKTKINTELKQSVDYKRKLALLDKEESSLESEIQTILKLGLDDFFEKRQWASHETSTIEEETDTLYFARIARRNSSRLGFRRGRIGAPFTRLGRQSVISQSNSTADSGISQGTYYASANHEWVEGN